MPTTLPFITIDLQEGSRHIAIEGVANGEKCRMLLDTGASKSVIDRNFLLKLDEGVEMVENEELSSGLGTNTMQSQVARLKKLEIDSLSWDDFEITVLDLTHVNDSYAKLDLEPVYIVLGTDIFFDHEAVIDFKEGTIRLK